MEISKALWYLQDFTHVTMNSDFVDAVNTVVAEYKRLEKEMIVLKKDKEV